MIKNIIFDLGNIIINGNNDKILMHITKDLKIAKDIERYIFKTEEWKLLDLGNITKEKAILQMQEKAPKEYRQFIEEIMNKRTQYLAINYPTIEIAKKLKNKGYDIYVLSNMATFIYEYFQNIDFFNFCNGIVVSAYEHVIKPDKKIFEILLNRYHLKPEECLFIDDDDTGKSFETANKLGILGRKVKPNDSQDVLTLLAEYKIEV